MRPKRNRIIYLPATDLQIHPLAQRESSPSKLRNIMENFDLDAVGTLHAVYYEIDGELAHWVVDGQHRANALKLLGLGDWKVNVEVHPCDNDECASRLFLKLNNRAPVPAYFKFVNELQAGEEVALGVVRVLDKHGLEVARQIGDGKVVAVTANKSIYANLGENILDDTYTLIIEAWGRIPDALEGKLVEGVASVLNTYNGEIDYGVLRKKLAKYPGGASGILGDAKGLRRIRGGSLASNIAETLVETYNRGRRKRLSA